MNHRLDFAAVILAVSFAMVLQKVDWEWRLGSLPGPPAQCTEIVLPPLPVREAWLPKRIEPHTRPASPIEGAEAEFYVVTGYAVGDRHTPGEITADGRKVRPGITVACPEELTLGTIVYIEGVGARVCEDRGAFEGKWLDLAFETREEALLWGKRLLAVAIIR